MGHKASQVWQYFCRTLDWNVDFGRPLWLKNWFNPRMLGNILLRFELLSAEDAKSSVGGRGKRYRCHSIVTVSWEQVQLPFVVGS